MQSGTVMMRNLTCLIMLTSWKKCDSRDPMWSTYHFSYENVKMDNLSIHKSLCHKWRKWKVYYCLGCKPQVLSAVISGEVGTEIKLTSSHFCKFLPWIRNPLSGLSIQNHGDWVMLLNRKGNMSLWIVCFGATACKSDFCRLYWVNWHLLHSIMWFPKSRLISGLQTWAAVNCFHAKCSQMCCR